MTLKHTLAAVAMTFAVTMAANAAQPDQMTSHSAQATSVVASAPQFTKQHVDGEGGSAALNRFTRTGHAEQ